MAISSSWQNALANPNSPPFRARAHTSNSIPMAEIGQSPEPPDAQACPIPQQPENCCSYWIVERRRYRQTALKFSMNAQNSRR